MRRCSAISRRIARTVLRRRVMVDVSKIDTSLDVLGQKLAVPDHARAGEQEPRRAARATRSRRSARTAPKRIYGIVGNATRSSADLTKAGQAPSWMASTLGQHARRGERRLGAAQQGSRRDLAERHRRSPVHAESRQQHPQRLSRLRSRRAAAVDAQRDVGVPRMDAQRLEAADHRQGDPERRGRRGGGEVRRRTRSSCRTMADAPTTAPCRR